MLSLNYEPRREVGKTPKLGFISAAASIVYACTIAVMTAWDPDGTRSDWGWVWILVYCMTPVVVIFSFIALFTAHKHKVQFLWSVFALILTAVTIYCFVCHIEDVIVT
jgi:ABC-type Fe3+ transport system permease subunit